MEHSTPMLEVGDVIEVEVQSAEEFGIFCRYESETVLVRIPEISWIASFASCDQVTQAGDRLTVKVTHVDHETGRFAVSIKDLHPNPWKTDQLQVGKQHLARVVRYVPAADRCGDRPGYLIEVLPGALAMMCAGDSSFEPGQQCTVTIRESDPVWRAVEVTAMSLGEQS